MSDNLGQFITTGQSAGLPKEKPQPLVSEQTEPIEQTGQSVPLHQIPPLHRVNQLNVAHPSSAEHLWRSINKPISLLPR